MFDILNIPLPVLPESVQGMVIGLAAFVAGLVMLSLGRVVVWRIVAALLLAGLGAAIGSAIAAAADINPTAPVIVGAVILAVLGAVLARLWWGVLLGATLASLALLIVIRGVVTPEAAKLPQGFEEALAFGAWLPKAAGVVGQWLAWLWKDHPLAELAAGGLPIVLGLVVGFARPAVTRILMTSVMGAFSTVTGACIMLQAARPGLDVLTGWRGWLLVVVGLLLAALGISFQSRAQMRSSKKTDEEVEAAPPPRRPSSKT